MPEAVKIRRRYESPRRRAQAAATRRDILDAAQRLFERDSYATTTMAAIAAEAGVALKTVYLAFETKGGLLRALWHLLLRGDEEAVPMGERDWYREVLAESDPHRQLEITAVNSRIVKLRIGGILEVIRAAASTDSDAAQLWGRIQTEFRKLLGGVVKSIGDKGALRRGLDVDKGADILWTLHHPSTWQLLAVECGWKPEEYERWTAEASIEQLLGPRRTGTRGKR